MKLYLLATSKGLVPMTDEDYDEKKKLKIGKVYRAEINIPRNYEFLKKYHALINCAWEYLPESQTKGFKTKQIFRKWCEIQAGHCDILQFKDGSFMRIPKSIAFDSIDEAEFSSVYDSVKDVIFDLIGRYVSEEEFEKNLLSF